MRLLLVFACLSSVPFIYATEPSHFNLQSFLHSFRHPKLLNLGPLRAGARQLIDSNRCDLENPAYEYVAGMVVNAPDCIVSEKPFVNSVEECLNLCKQEPLCASMELTEGVCTLYAISYDKNPSKFEQKDVKGLHAVIQRRCNETTCGAPWETKVYEGYRLTGFVDRVRDGCSKDECIKACADETRFPCKSVNYDPTMRVCELNGRSRQNLASLKSLVYDTNSLYIENSCVSEPSMVCTFEKQENMIPNAFDAFHVDVRNEEGCKAKCDNSPLKCRSYTFGLVANIPMCFLTHTVSSESIEAQEAMCILSNVNTTELKNCYDFDAVCTPDGFQVTFHASREFDGIVFPPESPYCQVHVDNAHTFTFSVTSNNFSECGIMSDGNGHYWSELQLQHYKPVLSDADFIIKAECDVDPSLTEEPKEPGEITTTEHTQISTEEPIITEAPVTPEIVTEAHVTPEIVTEAPITPEISTEAPITPEISTEAQITPEISTEEPSPMSTTSMSQITEAPIEPITCPEPIIPEPQIIYETASCPPTPECPVCKPIGPPRLGITVLHRNVTELTEDPKIGDPVSLAFFTSDINSPFGPRITDVAAVNVNDDSIFQMIDKRGCPAKPYIAGKIYKKQDGLYMSDFEAFTFNQLDTIRYRASVEWCWGECKPAICDEDDDELANHNDVYLDSLQNRIYK